MRQPLLQMNGITKSFGGISALRAVSLRVGAGEVHALLGENGAGKSTLLKILSGAQAPDAGEIDFLGAKATFNSPQDAQRSGIATIYQELTLVPGMSIAENIFLGREPGRASFVNWGRLFDEAQGLMSKVGLEKNPRTLARDLSVAEQQLVEIARALSMKSKLIIMDEPTAALSNAEVDRLFHIVSGFRGEGLSVIFVTHRLEEVMRVCDRFTILRDGSFVCEGGVADTSIDAIIRHMVGREITAMQRRPAPAATEAAVLRVENLSRRRGPEGLNAMALHDICFEVRRGEILGIAGLVGSGRTETARAIFGADPFDSGEIFVDGVSLRPTSPQDAIRKGIGLVPEDRKQQALFLSQSIRANLTVTAQNRVSRLGVFIDSSAEDTLIAEYRKMLRIRMLGPEQIVSDLSGGNQQKIVLARWLALGPKVLIVDEPTRGIDVGAKAEVHNLLFQMARTGIAIVVISSELPEVLAISDRIITMREGRVTGEVQADAANPEMLMALMTVDAVAA
ncbi:sugar ABC transporter ATP-binding protein [Mesorhizobium sp.]|uniref:sugar ABC transporter ATP-binding protein n=1 Tax=Mesorhizobium sp. TaxID=1871066 RepID=UPI00122376BF|nr:sugar ABC transporter ATP-binding protein [Mesorhizobium sp.]TIV56106.1 MAG: sugar ABC transporter ATP-binding protein [Mesorhizobium sp.]